jgi:hypothetical protein
MRRIKWGGVAAQRRAAPRPATGRRCAAPAGARHPGDRQGSGRLDLCGLRLAPPAGKVWPRAPWVDARGRPQVLPEVEQHVDHARSSFPRRSERAGVIAVAHHLPLATEHAVHGEGQPDGEPVHAAAGPARIVSLDDEVTVVLLDREMDHPKAIRRRPGDGTPERPEHAGRAKRRQARRGPNGDLHRIARVDLGPRDMRHRRAAPRFATRAFAGPTPSSRCRKRQSHLRRRF